MWLPPWGPISGGSSMPWGTSSRCGILAATASTLDSTLAAGFGTMYVADTVGASSRRAANAVWNTVDAVGTSSRRVRSGMISILAIIDLESHFCQYHASLVNYRFLSSYNAKSRIYVVFHEFYDHLTCLYICLRGFRLTARCLSRRRVPPNGAQHKRWRGGAQ
jgi:hypothetical protein